MENSRAREFLERLIHERRENYDALSRLIGRNPSYIQQYIKRGTPRKLSETDRRTLARYFGVDEQQIGRASCRERVCQYVSISVVDVSLKKKKSKIIQDKKLKL